VPIVSTPADISTDAEPEAEPLLETGLRAEVSIAVGKEPLGNFEIGQGEHVIGRDPACDIPIDAEDVSRRHARLTFSGYEFVIENLGSTNGVHVEGVRIELPTRIFPEQEIQIGRAHLHVRLNEATSRELARSLWDVDLGLASAKAVLKSDKYRIGYTIGHGGMGTVLQVRDLHIRRAVAMKIMRPELQFDPESLLRFIDEAQLTGQLEHPNIVPVYELGVDDQGRVFYSMKHVHGVTLDEVFRQLRAGDEKAIEEYPLAHLLNIFQKVCDGVAFAHSKGVVHRDLKPENIMIGGFGEVLVMDWGLAKVRGTEQRGRPRHELRSIGRDAGSFQTMDGLVIGTPPYIAPEQARGEIDKLDTRTDIYGLGAILYTILALRPPIEKSSVDEVLKKTIEGDILPLSTYNTPRPAGADERQIPLRHCPGGKIPESLSAVTMKALRLDPAKRYQTVEELQRDIESYQGGFATAAEQAGALKQIVLLIKRHKTEFTLLVAGLLVLIVVVAGFIVSLSREKNRARRSEQRAIASEKQTRESEKRAREALEELRGTAPTFAEEAQQLVDDGHFNQAMDKISYAISQVPNQSSYFTLQGHIWESLLRLDEALLSYQSALQRNPQDKSAAENLQLCRKLLARAKDAENLPPGVLRELQIAMRNQNRYAEAVAMMEKIENDRELFADTWRELFQKRGLRGKVQLDEERTLQVEVAKGAAQNLKLLRGMPITTLNLDGVKLDDVTPLQGLPLKSLNLSHTEVADLGPLRNMKLQRLTLVETRVADLRPLAGMRLQQLSLGGSTNVKDIAPLKGMPLEVLNLARTRVTDLAPLAGAPLREIYLEGCRELFNVSPLANCKQLETLVLPNHVKQIEFLRNHPALKRLSYKKPDQTAEEFWKEFDAGKK
jgi:serine/threonine protein kinase